MRIHSITGRTIGPAIQSFFSVLLIFFLSCSAKGPPFPSLPEGMPLLKEGHFRFTPAVPFYESYQKGALSIEKSLHSASFTIRIVGKNRAGAIRIRSYEGTARNLGDILELRSEHCYVFGKRSWDDRLVPMERWDCDHLIFDFHTVSGRIVSVPTERTVYSDWFGAVELRPMPEKSVFAGQILTLLDDGRFAAYGFHAGELLRGGQKLFVQDEAGKEVGAAMVEERIGDFVIARWESGERTGTVVYTTTQPSRPGLF